MRIISGKFKGRNLYAPKSNATRPTQGALRESVFNICQSDIENATFLDLFAGSGAMGFEALSRGAAHVTLVESNKQAIISIKKNIELLGVSDQVTLMHMDATIALARFVKPFDIIYVDPPYEMSVKVILREISNVLKENGNLFVEVLYNPKNQTEFTIPSLTLKSNRKFGSAFLQHFVK